MRTPLTKIKQIIKNQIGLDSSTIGDNTIESIIHQRMHQCGIDDCEHYLSLINNNKDELNELLEITVIPETWFFRDIRPFEIIYNKIQQQLLINRSKRFKILSLPSSTGEEPYSLAMFLIDKGIIQSTFEIDAVDISNSALQHAQQGIYGNNSFRGKHYPRYQKVHFKYNGSTYEINQGIREKVKFYRLNILHKNAELHNKFDFILCRNLLIYFDMDTKKIAFNQLADFLSSDGYLFIGHSEFGAVPTELFKNTGCEQAFALIKHSHPDFTDAPTTDLKGEIHSKPEPKIKIPVKKVNFESLIQKTEKDTISSNQRALNISLTDIKCLADADKLSQAQDACQLYIKTNGENADVLFLSGLVFSQQDDKKNAEAYFRKCLFLDPKHYESLMYLALLLEDIGDLKNSALLKQRANRVFTANENKT